MDVVATQPSNKPFQDKESLLDYDCINMKPLSFNGESPPAMSPIQQTAVAHVEAHPPTHPVLVQDMAEYVRNAIQNKALRQEHELIKKGQLHSWNRAEDIAVKEKNRYAKLLAYDRTRVVLEPVDGNPSSDYINANYIDGYHKPKAYIATQGPKENTCSDFWRMVWHEKSSKIVMLTNIVEIGKKKCEAYWPEAVRMYDSITVTLEKTEVSADYTIRTFRLKKTNDTRVHHVQQFHYTSWPDHGVPMYPSVLVAFIKKIKSVPSPADSGPVIVHCSAGIGRTGTVIIIDSMMDMGNEEKKVDVLRFLYEMRQQRVNILDNPDQYEFVHTALVEALLIDSTSIPSSKFPTYFSQLTSKNEKLIKIEVQQQYKILESYRPVHQSTHTRAGLDPQNAAKNRNSEILPDEKQRVFLKQTSQHQSDYINGIYVSGYKQKDSFIVTQFPLPSTIDDYWRLVLEKCCPLIVILNDLDPSDQTAPVFWPLETRSITFGSIQVTTTNIENDNGILVYSLTVKGSTKGTNHPMSVTLIHYPFWRHQQDIPSSSDKFVQLFDLTLRYRQTLQTGSVLITCYDGSSSSGLFCALAFICEKIKVEQEVDVFTAVRSIRTHRPSFIKNMEQYLFCYEGTMSFLESFALYANFQ